jgi:type I restriction enzyme, S subunit
MASEWRTATVQQLVQEDVLERPIDGNHGEIHPKTSDFIDRGIPFIMASDLVGGHVDTTHCAFISEKQARSLRKGFSFPGDVLISHKATMGRTAIVDQLNVPFLMLTPQVTYYRVKDQTRLDRRYLKLYFDSPEFQKLFETWGQKGSTRAYVGITDQLNLPIVLPPPHEQRAIAHILGTLDDKIELNRRMNETLEAMARARFKSWFVDFDPVRAKAEGRDPGLPKEIADLFPSRLVDSELGEIPERWEVGRLDNVLLLQRGFDLPSTKRTAGIYPVLAASGPSGTHDEFMVRGPGVTTGRSGVLGNVFYVHDDFWPLNTSLWVKEFRHSMPAYAFHLLWGLDFQSFNAGSAVPTLNRNHVRNLSALLPPMGLIASFESIATATLKRQKNNDDQSLTLTALRNSLLPKLISGALRVNDAEKFAEAALGFM